MFVEFFKAFHLFRDKLHGVDGPFFLVLSFRQLSYVDDVVAYARNQLDTLVGQHVDLFYLVTPEMICHEGLCNGGEVGYGKSLADVSRGDNEVAGVVGVGHDAVFVVDVVVVAVVGLYPDDGHQLCERDVDVAVLCLVTLGGLHERTALERFFHFAGVDLGDALVERVDLGLLQPSLYLGGVDESVGILVGNIHDDLGAYLRAFIGFVERGESQDKIGSQHNVECDDDGFLPDHVCIISCFEVFLLFQERSCPGRLLQARPVRRSHGF